MFGLVLVGVGFYGLTFGWFGLCCVMFLFVVRFVCLCFMIIKIILCVLLGCCCLLVCFCGVVVLLFGLRLCV